MRHWHFYEKVYRRWVVLMIGGFDEFKGELEANGFKEMDCIEDAKGMCVELLPENNEAGQNCTIIWLKEYETATLVHEISHLVMMCFTQTSVPISRDNTEAFAFYMEYWFAEIQRIRRRFPDGRTPAQAKRVDR